MTNIKPLFGIRFSPCSQDTLVAELLMPPEAGQGVRLVVTANVDHIVQLRTNAGLRSAYAHAWRRTIDGTPVYLFARMRRAGIEHKVAGADLFTDVMARMDPAKHRPYFVCAEHAIADDLRRALAVKGFTGDMVGTSVPPFGFEKDDSYGESMADAVRGHGTTHLFFGVGCPKSEIWIDRHRDTLGDLYACAVGAALAFHTGALRRAPYVVRRIGFEWLWRALQEPNRLLKRYFVHSWAFLSAVMDDLRGLTPAITR
jgi:N-acetylglucosaminyldiphosphoundecaprenol N-acetyl-beta-D-mannosaminyltransferase